MRNTQGSAAESIVSYMDTSRLLLVDGHSYVYRAFYAIRSLSSPAGQPTNAIYGFIRMVEKLRETLKPTHVLVIWDGGLDPVRKSAHPEYKANRAPTPLALETQIPGVCAWLKAEGIPSWVVDDTEADDWIATYCRRAGEAGWN